MLDLKLTNLFLSGMNCSMPEEFDPLRDQSGLLAFWRINKQSLTIQELQKTSNLEADKALPAKIHQYFFTTFFEYILTSDADYRKKNDPSLATILVTSAFTCVYDSYAGEPFNEEALKEWAKTIVVDESWPYFREHLHSTLLKMSLKPKILPSSPPRKSADQLS